MISLRYIKLSTTGAFMGVGWGRTPKPSIDTALALPQVPQRIERKNDV